MVWKQIKNLKFWQLIKLFKLYAFKPTWVFPTIKAIKETMQISEQYFPETHHQNGFPNAFRHALWNVLLCKKLYRKKHDLVKTIQKVDKITLLHEDLFKNDKLDRIMDVHNNRVGQKLFVKNAPLSVDKWINLLLEKEKTAVKFSAQADLKNLSETLIYLS